MVRATARPDLVVLAAARVTDEVLAAVHIRPVGESSATVGVDARIDQDDGALEERPIVANDDEGARPRLLYLLRG